MPPSRVDAIVSAERIWSKWKVTMRSALQAASASRKAVPFTSLTVSHGMPSRWQVALSGTRSGGAEVGTERS